MQRRKYLLLYKFVIAFLFVHLLVAKLYSEPYPSMIFPSFSKVEQLKDDYNISFSYIYGIDINYDTITIDKRKVFGNIKTDHVNHIIKTLKQKEEYIANQDAQYKRYGINNKLKRTLKERARFISMTSARLQRLYPNKTFKYLLLVEGAKRYHIGRKELDDTLLFEKRILIKLL